MPEQYPPTTNPEQSTHRPQTIAGLCVEDSSSALGGPIGSSCEGPIGDVRMRQPRQAQRFVTLQGAPPKAPVATFAC
eukprot:8331063-Pyramimonas_sp.AAC.1